MSEGDFSFMVTRTKADYFWAIMVSSLRTPIIPIFLAIALTGTLIFSALSEGALGMDQIVTAGLVYSLIVALYYISLLAMVWYVAQKNWNAPGALSPLSYVFTPAGVEVAYAMGRGETAWALWKSALETRNLILVRHGLGLLHIIPKRDLTPSDLSRLRAMLREHLGASARLSRE